MGVRVRPARTVANMRSAQLSRHGHWTPSAFAAWRAIRRMALTGRVELPRPRVLRGDLSRTSVAGDPPPTPTPGHADAPERAALKETTKSSGGPTDSLRDGLRDGLRIRPLGCADCCGGTLWAPAAPGSGEHAQAGPLSGGADGGTQVAMQGPATQRGIYTKLVAADGVLVHAAVEW
jgi:hypothetical protein